MHFITSGANEGRGITFDPLRYLASNLDVARAYGTNEARGLDHWLKHGFTENRQTASFDAAQYLANYADLRAAFGTDQRAATLHWLQSGAAEGRSNDRPLISHSSVGGAWIADYNFARPLTTTPTPLPL